MKVAILDDYQNVAQYFADWENSNCDIKVFEQPFENEEQAIENLKNFEALLLMRERTPMTRKLIESCPNLKIICTGFGSAPSGAHHSHAHWGAELAGVLPRGATLRSAAGYHPVL